MATAKKYRYKLVEFLDYENATKSIDIVPTNWITYDEETHDLFTPFIPDNSKENLSELKNRVKTERSPLKSWPKFRVAVKGYADTYNQAEKKISKLRNTTYAFTTDNDEEGARKKLQQKETYKLKGKRKDDFNILRGSVNNDLEQPLNKKNIGLSSDVPVT